MEFDEIQDFIDTMNAEDVQLDKADESAILLAALQENSTPEEFDLIMENLTELELYGLIDSAEVATEAKKIVYKQTKQMNLNREEAKACLRMAKKDGYSAYKKYAKGRAMMLQAREECFKHYHTQGKNAAKNIVNANKKKASAMVGKTMTGDVIYKNIGKAYKNMSRSGKQKSA